MLSLSIKSQSLFYSVSRIWHSWLLPLFQTFFSLASRPSPSLSFSLYYCPFLLCPFCFLKTYQAFSHVRIFLVSFPPNHIVLAPNIHMVLMPSTPWALSLNLTTMKPKLTILSKNYKHLSSILNPLTLLSFLFSSTCYHLTYYIIYLIIIHIFSYLPPFIRV